MAYKKILLLSFASLILIVVYNDYSLFSINILQGKNNIEALQTTTAQLNNITKTEKNITKTKYILLWTPNNCPSCAPFQSFGEGAYAFRRLLCPDQDCYLTTNRTLLDDYTQFDAILYNGRQILDMDKHDLPERRQSNQMNVFVQLESADRFPVCNEVYDNFFNRTFTFKLNSDWPWPYFKVSYLNGTIIGPNRTMNWIKHEDMKPVSLDIKEKIVQKKKLVSWFVSNCHTNSKREYFVKDLKHELNKYNETVDIFGKCGTLSCPRDTDCSEVAQHYLFYLSFENSFSEDYVTEKLLTALQNYVVPVVFGGANYDRFLPPGSYLDGRLLGAPKLAASMLEIATNRTLYEDLFRWKQYYKYDLVWPPPVCEMCAELHKESIEYTSYAKFREWWNPNYENRC